MSIDLGRRLLASGAIHAGELRRALFEAIARERPLACALAEISASARSLLEHALDEGGAPSVKSVVAHPDLLAALPPGLATRLLAVPMRKDARTGTIDVAVVDPNDPHVASEVSFHLGAPVRPIAAPLAEIERALMLDVHAPRKTTTAEYEAARPSQIPTPYTDEAPVIAASIGPASKPDEFAMPLVRRARGSLLPSESRSMPPPSEVPTSVRPSGPPPSMGPASMASTASVSITPASTAPASIAPASTAPASTAPASIAPASISPGSKMRASAAPPTTMPFERSEAPRVEMVVDFSAAARAEKEEAAASTRRGLPPVPSDRDAGPALEDKRPPFASLTPVLEQIDAITDRDGLIDALLRGLATTSTCAALFAPRRGRFVGVGASGALDPEIVRGAMVAASGAMAETVGNGERLGPLDPHIDRELWSALDLQRYGAPHVLLHASYLSDRAALVLVAFGMGDVTEATRRARVLATAASAAMTRILKR